MNPRKQEHTATPFWSSQIELGPHAKNKTKVEIEKKFKFNSWTYDWDNTAVSLVQEQRL